MAVALDPAVKRATKFISESETIKVTRQAGRRPRKNAKADTFLITIGRPNYAEREFIKECKRAGVKLPLRHPILKFFPKKGRRT